MLFVPHLHTLIYFVRQGFYLQNTASFRCTTLHGTYKNYTRYIKKFEKYVGSRDVYFDDIYVSVLKDYMAHMGNISKNGMRIEHLSKLMDHTDISTTQIYAKIISEELDKAVVSSIFQKTLR